MQENDSLHLKYFGTKYLFGEGKKKNKLLIGGVSWWKAMPTHIQRLTSRSIDPFCADCSHCYSIYSVYISSILLSKQST